MMMRPEDLLEAFPFLKTVPTSSREAFMAAALRKSLDDGQILVSGGAECAYLPLVLEGTLRVYKTSQTGRELTLYRIERGESCILSATCILTSGGFPAIAQSEGRSVVALAPARLLSSLVEEHAQWRGFVFGLYAKRLDMMLTLVEEVAFNHVDSRIAAYLLKSAEDTATVRTTHAEIASELATSREVVSRILKDFEAEGLVETHRGSIRIIGTEALKKKGGNSPPM